MTPIIPALTNVFNMALKGGGAKSINFQALASDLAQITFDYPFRIPPYFALIIRAIGVLEGIALVRGGAGWGDGESEGGGGGGSYRMGLNMRGTQTRK